MATSLEQWHLYRSDALSKLLAALSPGLVETAFVAKNSPIPSTCISYNTGNAMSKFSIIPDGSDLQSMGRDLKFYPVENPSPRTLSQEQIAHYNTQGYIAPLNVYSTSEIESIRKYFDELLERVVAEEIE